MGAENEIFNAIKSGKAKMRPRWYFVLRAALEIVLLVALLFLLLYIAIFIIVALHQTGAWFAIDFGFTGWYTLLWSLPWISVSLLILCLLLATVLMRKYAFVYEQPVIYALFLVVILAAGGSLLLASTPLSAQLFTGPEFLGSSLFGGFYQYETEPPSGVHRGEIVVLAMNGFIMQNADGVTTTVLYAPGINLPIVPNLQLGDFVVVLGGRDQGGFIQAFGIEKIAQ